MNKLTIEINVGDRNNMLTVTEVGLRKQPSPSRIRAGAKSEAAVRVVCDCGNSLLIRPSEFSKGIWISCGCYGRRAASTRATARNTTHGMSKHPFYETWSSMLDRCENPTNGDYHSYGGRGIAVCDQWHDPAAFLDYVDKVLGPRPEGHSLDRIDNDGPYAPGNVRWADARTQRRNQRRFKAVQDQ